MKNNRCKNTYQLNQNWKRDFIRNIAITDPNQQSILDFQPLDTHLQQSLKSSAANIQTDSKVKWSHLQFTTSILLLQQKFIFQLFSLMHKQFSLNFQANKEMQYTQSRN